MALKRKMTLATPILDSDGLGNHISNFKLNYLYINEDGITAYLAPDKIAPVQFYPPGTVNQFGDPVVAGRGVVVLTAAQALKVQNFIQVLEDAAKANLDTAWP